MRRLVRRLVRLIQRFAPMVAVAELLTRILFALLASQLPACLAEDSTNCAYWASEVGNGQGFDSVRVGGTAGRPWLLVRGDWHGNGDGPEAYPLLSPWSIELRD